MQGDITRHALLYTFEVPVYDDKNLLYAAWRGAPKLLHKFHAAC
jgi:hypothetical protein